MQRAFITVLIALSLIIPSAVLCAGDTGSIKGKVNSEGKPLEGAYVYLYAGYESGFNEGAAYKVGPTGKDGVFEVSAAPGSYYLIARKPVNGKDGQAAAGDYYAFYGGNPVKVEGGEQINIGINCSPIIDTAGAHIPGGTGIRGKVYADGKPLGRARVTLYQDGETIFRGIGYASMMTNDSGDFAFNLSPGSYYVLARKRMGKDSMGPLTEGDLFAFAHNNPVKVEEGSFTTVSMNAVTKLVKVKESGQEVTLGGTVKSGETVISGKVTDKDGKPVKGVYVSAYRDSMMIYKPDFISPITKEDGTYSITLSGGGEYFIMARDTIGGPAEKGDLLGRYNGNEDHSVILKDGEKLDGIDVVVETVR
jgi:hypothetical protein